jgi:hypothetical protein
MKINNYLIGGDIMRTASVTFLIGDTKITVETVSPNTMIKDEGRKVVIINNAIEKVKRDLGIDLRKVKDNIYNYATIVEY